MLEWECTSSQDASGALLLFLQCKPTIAEVMNCFPQVNFTMTVLKHKILILTFTTASSKENINFIAKQENEIY